MGRRARDRGFSLIELLVVTAILTILISMGYAALSRGRTMSKATRCLSNLKQVAAGLNLYFNEHKAYPSEGLPGALATYVGGNPDLFICPADRDPQGDSYTEFYVARTDQGAQNYVCCCPRHVDESSTITLFSSSAAHLLQMGPARWNGQAIRPGTSVGSGLMSFADGSTVTVPSGMVVRFIQSFRLHDGRLYSLIGVDINELGTLDIQVTPGSRFEVVTPAAIAGVQGTRFLLTTSILGEDMRVQVEVTEGEVTVKDRWKEEGRKVLRPGEHHGVKLHRGKMRALLRRRWKLRRKILDDDYLFETDATP